MIARVFDHAAAGHSAVFTKASRLVADLAGGHADHSWETGLGR